MPFDAGSVPAELRAALDADIEARTYQFVVKAIPMARPGLRELQHRLRDLARTRDDAERERDELRRVVARQASLEATVAALSGREGALRRSLVDAHDQLLRRDVEIEKIRAKANLADAYEQDIERLLGELEDKHQEMLAAVDNAGRQLDVLNAEIRRLRARIDRVRQSPPGRLYVKVRSLRGRASKQHG